MKFDRPGPWDSEPDHEEFEHAGMACVIHRGPVGAWCGYVRVPGGHRLHGVNYDDMVSGPPTACIERSIDGEKIGFITLMTASIGVDKASNSYRLDLLIDAHGGLTFSRPHAPGRDKVDGEWWLGFDCSHAGDACPGVRGYLSHADEQYRDAEYARGICRSIAEQISAWDSP